MPQEQSDQRWMAGQELPGVVTVGDPTLRTPARPVQEVSAVKPLCDRMVASLRDLSGAGLAANQVGEPVAIVVVEVRRTELFPDRPESPLYVMVNPEIVDRSSRLANDWEGCFSIPGLMGQVERSENITVEYMTPDGERRRDEFSGYLARVIQHECDHLAGTLFVDRMKSMDTLSTVSNYVQYHHAPSGG